MLQRVIPGLMGMTHIMAFDDEAQTEIEQFRRKIIERTGDRGQAECLSDQDPLREVLNTLGVEGRLEDSTSCAVSVLMLTERWDVRTVTHILSVRCRHSASLRTGGRPRPPPPVPRSERRESFNIEYADVLGIAFDVTAELAVAKQQKPRETVAGRAMSPKGMRARYLDHACPRRPRRTARRARGRNTRRGLEPDLFFLDAQE